jgi:hypothetical protein
MPAIQTTYTTEIAAGVAGHVADMRMAVMASRECDAAIGFGLPVFQGTAPHSIRLASGSQETVSGFVGVSVRDRSVTTGDAYAIRETARVLQQGPIWVTAAVQVAAGDPVAVTSAGAWSNVAGTNGLVIPGARWDTSTTGTGQLAVIAIK